MLDLQIPLCAILSTKDEYGMVAYRANEPTNALKC